ncbi:MAG TPA: pyridoxamine 5'-phosphate oxidase family protein [Pseudonocardiaceae bacterium]|jgi:hypothetical protein|nr:pyridoxamine 5'-phosphate oxidase family protein [Pseudonocardiaceae bacterium]
MSRTPLSPTTRSTIARKHDRAATDRAALDEVLDAGLICHLGFVSDGSPVVLPTGYGRDGDTLYLHGSSGARSLRLGATGVPVCVTVTLVDGIVYARSAFHHSMNYRSAVVHGNAVPVTERAAKLHALEVITEALAPGSWTHSRRPNPRELAATSVLAVDLAEASVKLRAGGPGDDEEDLASHQVWAGVLPLRQVWGEPEPADYVDLAIPAHIAERAVR